jgi:hypothetical protein
MDSAISGLLANSILGIIVASVFYGVEDPADALQQRSIVLFFALILNAFVPGTEVFIFPS